MKKQLLILMALLIASIGNSQTFVDNFITYEVTSSTTVRTTNYNTAGGTVVNIPATVTNASITYNVTNIGPNSFTNKQLTSIVIPASVTEIRSGAFQNNNLTSITIPVNVTNIQSWSFMGNPLTSVVSLNTVPPSIPNAGSSDAFDNRGNINIFIPIGTTGPYVTNVGAKWTGFNSVTEASLLVVGATFVNNFITYEVTSVTPNKVQTINYNMAGGSVVDIPNIVLFNGISYTVTQIGQYSFVNKGLTSLTYTLPSYVTNIGQLAFANNALTSITIPNSVISIRSEAFVDNSLTSITLSNSLVLIEFDAFAFNQLGSISFPSSLTTIGGGAFSNNLLTNVTIPSTITTLGNSVFSNNQLVSATFENVLTAIPSDLFFNNQLQSITIPVTVTSIGQDAFRNNQLTSIIWNNNISNIDSGAFRNNQLTSITIPNSVTTMGTSVFQDNPLTSVTSFATTPPTITTGTNDTFSNNRSNIHLHIPLGTTAAYVTNVGALWTGFNPVTEDALGTSNFELENEVKVITTSNRIELSYSNNVRLENYEIYNITGAKVKEGNENNNIAIDEIASGIYILKLNFDNGTVVRKVLIEK